ncbi:TlpA family protein disulfide reductase [Leptospira sp. 'Mane']|uniref:TlpA family protein disulfide reductase n=1 Tax=Leptospira sp. 'Mane' TaxID=3387407 RepID=UPI00398A8F75
MRYFSNSILFLIVISSLTFCKNTQDPTKSLIDLDLFTAKEEKVNFQNFQGKVVVLDFWATWCEPCKKAVPVVNAWKKSKEGSEFVFYGVNTDSDLPKEEIEKHQREWKMEYPSVLDRTWKLVENYKIDGMPCLLVFGKDGALVYRQYGLQAEDLAGLLIRSRIWKEESSISK